MSLVSRVKKAKCGVKRTLGIRNSTAMFSSVIQLVEKFLKESTLETGSRTRWLVVDGYLFMDSCLDFNGIMIGSLKRATYGDAAWFIFVGKSCRFLLAFLKGCIASEMLQLNMRHKKPLAKCDPPMYRKSKTDGIKKVALHDLTFNQTEMEPYCTLISTEYDIILL